MSTKQYNSGSNVRTPTMRSLYGATVVVDASQQAETRQWTRSRPMPAWSLLQKWSAAAPPRIYSGPVPAVDSVEISLTDWDMAFLKSLYRMPLDRRSRIQRGHLVEALLDERLPERASCKKP